MNPKVKIAKTKGIRACSLIRNTLGVKGRAKDPKCGLGILTSNSIIYMDLHKSNHKLVSA